MALISCPECGKEISDSSAQCIHCGYSIKSIIPDKDRTRQNKKAIFGTIAVTAVILGVAIFFFIKSIIIPGYAYNAAEKALFNEDYDVAAAQFSALGNYKDSKERSNECFYQKGKGLMSIQNYSEAIEAFEDSNYFADASIHIDIAEKKIMEEQDAAAYQAAIDKMKKAYKARRSPSTHLSSDGLSIVIDSNNNTNVASLFDISTVIEKLELPDSLIDNMKQTTAMMGKLSETYGDFNVTWSYHPDNGLDVIFRVID